MTRAPSFIQLEVETVGRNHQTSVHNVCTPPFWLDRRDLVWINVTANPTIEWIARRLTEAFLWDEAPHYLIRDRGRIYGTAVTYRFCAMDIQDNPTVAWQNGFAGQLIGSIWRE